MREEATTGENALVGTAGGYGDGYSKLSSVEHLAMPIYYGHVDNWGDLNIFNENITAIIFNNLMPYFIHSSYCNIVNQGL